MKRNPTRKKVESLPLIVYFPLSARPTLSIFEFECTCLMDLNLEGKLNLLQRGLGTNLSYESIQSASKVEYYKPWSTEKTGLSKGKESFVSGRKANQRRILKDFVLLLVLVEVFVKQRDNFLLPLMIL